jgi:hypothetical protein
MGGFLRLARDGGGWAAVALVLSFLTAEMSPTHAIPAFARKYETSCQTCHIAYPRLTPFGEAFRLNGFRFPEGRDAEMEKSHPVSLGAEGYKKMWPKSVWPADIPGLPPVSFLLATEAAYVPDSDTPSQFTEIEAELLAGGTVGDNVSFYGELEFALELETNETETAIERAYISFLPWVKPVFGVKIGQFEPGIALVSNHRRLTGARYWLMRPPKGLAGSGEVVIDNAFQLEAPAQDGIEFWGIISHRALWNAGYVEGKFNETNNAKDAYGRIAAKWGGMRLDGTVSEGQELDIQTPQPWRELSITASAFFYAGKSSLEVAAGPPQVLQDDDFTIAGVDVQLNLNDFIVNAGFSSGNNDNPDVNGTFTDVDSVTMFAEVDWVAYPWLIPALRYETFELTDGFSDDKRVRWVPAVNFLIRANVKGFVSAEIERERQGDFGTEEIEAGLTIVF